MVAFLDAPSVSLWWSLCDRYASWCVGQEKIYSQFGHCRACPKNMHSHSGLRQMSKAVWSSETDMRYTEAQKSFKFSMQSLLWPLVVCYYSSFGQYLCSEYNMTVMQIVSRVLLRRVVIVAALILTGDGSFFRCALSVTLVVTLWQVCLLMHWAGEDLFPVWPL